MKAKSVWKQNSQLNFVKPDYYSKQKCTHLLKIFYNSLIVLQVTNYVELHSLLGLTSKFVCLCMDQRKW